MVCQIQDTIKMKKCPSCKVEYLDSETVCPDCWSHQILLEIPQAYPELPQTEPEPPEPLPASPQTVPQRIPETRGFFQFTIEFFNNSLQLFSIIGIIVTILTLFPLFVTFILGDNWFNLLLGD